jgi:hypothetical protein
MTYITMISGMCTIVRSTREPSCNVIQAIVQAVVCACTPKPPHQRSALGIALLRMHSCSIGVHSGYYCATSGCSACRQGVGHNAAGAWCVQEQDRSPMLAAGPMCTAPDVATPVRSAMLPLRSRSDPSRLGPLGDAPLKVPFGGPQLTARMRRERLGLRREPADFVSACGGDWAHMYSLRPE